MSQSNELLPRRISSPSAHAVSTVSTSPRPSALSRPHWPWTTHTHRPSSSSSSLHSVTASPAIVPNMSWEAGSSTSTTARQSAGSRHGSVNNLQVEETIRQWNFTAFEWTVRNVHALREFVEQGQTINATDVPEEPHEVLRESPVLGDGKFKLEIVRAPSHPEISSNTPTHSSSPLAQQPIQPVQSSTNLSLCVTSLMLDLAQGPEYDVAATMFAALAAVQDRRGERGAPTEWVWEYWEKDWSFRQDSEVWECTLPSLSSLLDNARIAETDSFVICIQIHSPIGPQFPQHPSAHYVPRDLLDGVEASLDNPHTGDVKFICLERYPQSSDPASPVIPATPHTRRPSSETSSTVHPTARKRVLFAHSDILIRRSEYFATMLSSSFAENASVPHGERKLYEIVVEEADFVTIYWLLKWVYANWLLFKEVDDPRASVDGMGDGWSAKWLSSRGGGGEWDWKIIGKAGIYDDTSAGSRDDDGQERSAHSGESSVGGRPSSAVDKGKRSFRSSSGSAPIHPSSGPSSSRPSLRLTSVSGTRTSVPGESTSTAPSRRAIPSSSKATPVEAGQPSPSTNRAPSVPGSAYNYPLSPRQARQHINQQQADPHPHPTPPPPPTSALSIWQVAHRYAMPGLSSLALSHMMNTLKPATAFPLLLATSFWEDLHALVEDYIVEQWDVACESQEFEQCCQEVAAGDWGPEGGKTLAALFRRLRSPSQYGRA